MFITRNCIYLLIFAVGFTLCGAPEVLAQEPSSQSGQQTQQQAPSPGSGVSVNPAQAPLSPAPAPEEPTTIYEAPNAPAPQTTRQQEQTQRPHEPLGAATAGEVRTEGGGASRPAGTAIAPAKQHQVRSFLIKLGAVAAAGVAIGTIYALSKGTSSVPPNSGR